MLRPALGFHLSKELSLDSWTPKGKRPILLTKKFLEEVSIIDGEMNRFKSVLSMQCHKKWSAELEKGSIIKLAPFNV